MAKTPQNQKTKALTRILRRINQGTDPRILRAEAHRLIAQITPHDLALAERRLVQSGFSSELAGQLSVAFILMGILEGQSVHLKDRLAPNHVLRLILAEHDLMRCFAADLQEAAEQIAARDTMSDTSSEFMRLSHIAEHFYAMLEHMEREDDVIFPALHGQGWTSLCRAAHNEHERIRSDVDNLLRLIGAFRAETFGPFKLRLASLAESLSSTLLEHFYQEDNVLFPIALEVVNDERIWQRIKAVADDIGYCGVHL